MFGGDSTESVFMCAIVAILTGLLMVWMQAVASVAPHLIEQTVACQCCKCGHAACATQTTVPAPMPSPVAASESIATKEKSSVPIQVAQIQPATVEAGGDRTPTPACPLPALPVFRRHCVLLI